MTQSVYPKRLNDPVLHIIATILLKRWGGENAVQLAEERLGDGGPIGILDYWDFVACIEGMTLKPTVERLTATTCTWSAQPETIRLVDLKLYSPIDVFSSLGIDDPTSVYDIKGYLDNKHGTRASLKETLSQGEFEPKVGIVILRKLYDQKGQAKYGIDDGNEIVRDALLTGKITIQAYVCDTHGRLPKDYWVPVIDLLRLVRQCRQHRYNPLAVLAARLQLHFLLSSSELARIAYRERVVGREGGAKLIGWGLY